MNNQIISIAYSTFINKGAFALLLGSGISRKSGIPTGWEITLKLIAQLATLEKQNASPNLEQWYKQFYGTDPDYSDILEHLTNTPEERLNLLRPFIEPTSAELEEGLKLPTSAHKQIARLVKEGYIKVIVTTNFDRLLENALKDHGIEPTVISNPEHIENSIPLIHSNITVIKINGDYLDTKFLNIKSELEQYDFRLVEMLKFVFENYGLITCGWSAQWDIALVNILKSSNKFRYSNYFTYLTKINADLKDLSNYRKGQLVQINDADSFFTELIEDIEALENGHDAHPLTGQIASQLLKKYISKEEYLISYHDLIKDLVNDLLSKNKAVSLTGSPTQESIKSAKEQYLTNLSLMVPALINSTYWSKPYHSQIILNSIRTITSFSEANNSTSYAVWRRIVYLPTLLLRYACGISCIAKTNYELLFSLFSLEIKTKYKMESIVELTYAGEVIEATILNAVDKTDLPMPMSHLVYQYLRPYFNELLPIDADYDQCFDYYEIIFAIMYNRSQKDNWYPGGLFVYRNNNIVEEFRQNIVAQSENHGLLNIRFFDSIAAFKEETQRLSEFFNAIR